MLISQIFSLFLVLLCCELCLTIQVPTTWDQSEISEVQNGQLQQSQVEIITPQNVHINRPESANPIPVEYFEYTAQKPKFAADIAAYHGVQNPEQHYKAYAIKPYTGKQKPLLGIHHMLDEDKTIYQPFQKYVVQSDDINGYVKPTSSGYEIFHPYKAEEPGLQNLYKDPILTKIRNDVQNSKHILQNYEEEAGKPNIASEEYLETPEQTDSKIFPHKNVPVPYEIHRPERRPLYYRPPMRNPYREQMLNQKLKHPWNQYAKIRPLHYRPIKNHIKNLRQQHAMKFDDERNEYPQVPLAETIAEVPDGYDIYEKGKEKYTQLRNNVDESINQAIKKNRPVMYENLEINNNDSDNNNEPEEFVPIKNYAQVRKTESYKHLPKKAAFDDADTYEEILNAPRLREAVKSTKAQTVYSEEGYEDAAYDHAGEQKHALENEGHGGFLKSNENSGGRYKIPSVSGKYEDTDGSKYRDKTEHSEKWQNDDKDDEEEIESEDYSEVEEDQSNEAEIYKGDGPEIGNRNKREDELKNPSEDHTIIMKNNRFDNNKHNSSNTHNDETKNYNSSDAQHSVDKRQVQFDLPKINLNSTHITESEILELAKLKVLPSQPESFKDKYPYYFNKIKGIHKNSPLRYSENLELIPKKSKGGTEFYDSRSKIVCSEVDEDIDPIPEKLKNGENPTEDNDDESSETKGEKEIENVKDQRLKGLGDKIDCFKAKYFGEDPLDSPFFKEKIIANPDPVTTPNLPIFKANRNLKHPNQQSIVINDVTKSLSKEIINPDVFVLRDKLSSDQLESQYSVNYKDKNKLKAFNSNKPYSALNSNIQNSSTRSDILKNVVTTLLDVGNDTPNISNIFFHNKEEVTRVPPKLRRKRATHFVYEPYKIIRDSQVQDSKKTTTTSNISPLIKQLQSSNIADRVSRSNRDDKRVKQNSNTRMYVDIGRKERTNGKSNNEDSDASFVDVSIDQRRGEPRYELRPSNHKPEYKPVENKRAMSVEDFNSHTTSTEKNNNTHSPSRGKQRFGMTLTTVRPYYDVLEYIPKQSDFQTAAASNEVKNTVTTSTPATSTQNEESNEEDSDEESDEDYEEEEEGENNEEGEEAKQYTTPVPTTTTTQKPIFRKKIRLSTERPYEVAEDQEPKLKLVTRFRNFSPSTETKKRVNESPTRKYMESEIVTPKYMEKKKKSSTRTLVTDTKKYGNEDDDELKEEDMDALIGIKQDMSDYMPSYEKEEEERELERNKSDKDSNDEESDDDDEDEDDEDESNEDDDDDDDDDDDENDGEGKEDEEGQEISASEPKVTTPEPAKRTLPRTTDAPPPTVASHTRKILPSPPSRIKNQENKPVITRKRIEIHKELPVNNSLPHTTQFKQDISEIEIIKQMPRTRKKKPQKKVEALELYKDDNLAKEVNNLGDIEIFSDDINVDKGPKHGGNYRKATKEDIKHLKLNKNENSPRDAETSQSKNDKHIELETVSRQNLHGGNLRSLSDLKHSRNDGRSAKLIELSDTPLKSLHGGNLKHENKHRSGRRNEKLIELEEENIDDHSPSQDYDFVPNSSSSGQMHGGNYRSAKLVAQQQGDTQVKDPTKEARRSATVLLKSLIQAAPVLTTTPVYILDPSKRMYYYVD